MSALTQALSNAIKIKHWYMITVFIKAFSFAEQVLHVKELLCFVGMLVVWTLSVHSLEISKKWHLMLTRCPRCSLGSTCNYVWNLQNLFEVNGSKLNNFAPTMYGPLSMSLCSFHEFFHSQWERLKHFHATHYHPSNSRYVEVYVHMYTSICTIQNRDV